MSSIFGKSSLTDEQILAEIEDVIRTAPPFGLMGDDTADQHAWFGRAVAILSEWNPVGRLSYGHSAEAAFSGSLRMSKAGARAIMIALQQARHDIRLRSVGPLAIAVQQGAVFDYFDELRKVIEIAQAELFFVDPYMDSDFVSRYLPHIRAGVSVRLLGKEYMAKLLPAVELLRQQAGAVIEVRSEDSLHDRYVFIDRSACYQSGASFKDGAKKSATTLTQITDAFDAVYRTYDDLWQSATQR